MLSKEREGESEWKNYLWTASIDFEVSQFGQPTYAVAE